MRRSTIPSRPPVLAAATLVVSVACSAPPPAAVMPAVDPEQIALALEDRTALAYPARILFDWNLNESGMRVSGRGVARVEPPYRARLDLFLESGETVVRAALVNGDLRLPPGAGGGAGLLPPPDLLWAVMGVFRPEFGIELMGGERLDGGQIRLRYRYPDASELQYRVTDGRVRQVEVLDGGRAVERVEIGLEASSPFPTEATYRNLADFRELRITRTGVERVESYPPDIWDPSGPAGAPRW